MSFEIKQATRIGVRALIGLYGRSGSGKTMSALLLARGIAGPHGKITLIDSESSRGSLFADIIPGGYNVIEIGPPFSPERYQEAFEVAEAVSNVVVIDSLSHEHAGEGGVLDMQEAELDRMAGDNYQKREACKMSAWIKPKMAHKKFIQRILRCRCALICCLRGEEKTHMLKEDGKNKVITDQFSTPIFDSRFIFELLVNFETISNAGKGGYVIARKITHPAIEALLPRENEQIGIKHGEAIAKWASSGQESSPQTPKVKPKSAKAELWKIAQPKFDNAPNFEKWLQDKKHIGNDQTLSGLSEPELTALIPIVQEAEYVF